MDPIARDACMELSRDLSMEMDAAGKVLRALSDYCAPDAPGNVYHGAARPLWRMRAAEAMDAPSPADARRRRQVRSLATEDRIPKQLSGPLPEAFAECAPAPG